MKKLVIHRDHLEIGSYKVDTLHIPHDGDIQCSGDFYNVFLSSNEDAARYFYLIQGDYIGKSRSVDIVQSYNEHIEGIKHDVHRVENTPASILYNTEKWFEEFQDF